MHLTDTELKMMLNKAAKAKLTNKGEATDDKDNHEHTNQINDSGIAILTLLLAILFATVQFVLGNLWIGFFIIINSLMASASAFLAALWISSLRDVDSKKNLTTDL